MGGYTISVWVHVRHKGVVGAIAGFEEQGHTGDEAEHGALLVRVGEADSNEEGAGDDGENMDKVFLAPDTALPVDEVGDDTAHGSEDDVEQAEHGGPVSGTGLAELGEVFDVVGAEDGVDG